MRKQQNLSIKVGTVVLIREEGKSRLQWPLGVVTRVFEGRDGLIRAVELKAIKGLLTRTIQKLHKLEMLDEEEPKPTPQDPNEREDSELDADKDREPGSETRVAEGSRVEIDQGLPPQDTLATPKKQTSSLF